MNKRVRKIIVSSMIAGSILGGLPVSNANANSVNLENINGIEFDKNLVIKESNSGEINSFEDIENNPNYVITGKGTTTEKISEDAIAEIETVYYDIIETDNQRAVSNGTKFGTYSTITIRDIYYGRLMGKVGVEAQGQKISATKAKLVFIKYQNTTKFANNGKGAYKKFGTGNTGNPAIGTVLVSYKTQNGDAEWVTNERIIYVKVYPTTKIKITL
ncbi:MAG: hypothetical protein RSG52_02585 [Terrisporobacter sp.]|uniref:hypothetical protein n=1 Tax=Terrisporobacter sp. TaxID=1965305 RepID=UPI002FCB4D89